ncbi:hypothetical protein JCM10908_003997 [Rhodotorula pacifica]|uniref:uncharacterized protein n=1 Tax=Rhodotorula pacifica TaxID=1495444 RepID=UPI00316BE2E4
MSYYAAYAEKRSISRSVDPEAANVSTRSSHPLPRHRSHAPSPFLSPHSSAKHAAEQNRAQIRMLPREKREPAPSVEPPPPPSKVRKIEQEERDAAILADLFGEGVSDVEGAQDEFEGRMAPPPVPLHRTRPHLDTPACETTAGLDADRDAWPPVAHPSGLHRRRGRADTSGDEDGSGRGVGSEDELRESDVERSSRSSTYQPSERSAKISLFSAASSEEGSDSSDAASEEETERRYERRRAPPGSKGQVTKPRKRRRPTAQQLKEQAVAKATDFLAGIDLPQPAYKPLSVKARLANQLAEQTKILPVNARVDHVSTPEEKAPGSRVAPNRVESTVSREAVDDPPAANNDGVGGSDPSTSSARPASPVAYGGTSDELPDYEDDEAPEASLAPKYEDLELVQQAYFRKPTREGALYRWAALLEKDAEDLPEGLSYSALETDLKALQDLGITPATTGVTLPGLPWDFQAPHMRKLLSTRPPARVCDDLWTDLLDPSHPERHTAEPGRGPACLCPLWEPPRRVGFEAELISLERKYGVKADDLVTVLHLVFGLPVRSDDSIESRTNVLQLVHENNWLWFDQIVQMANLRQVYRRLSDDDLLQLLDRTIRALDEEGRIRLRKMRTACELNQKEAKKPGIQLNATLHRDLLLTESRNAYEYVVFTFLALFL